VCRAGGEVAHGRLGPRTSKDGQGASAGERIRQADTGVRLLTGSWAVRPRLGRSRAQSNRIQEGSTRQPYAAGGDVRCASRNVGICPESGHIFHTVQAVRSTFYGPRRGRIAQLSGDRHSRPRPASAATRRHALTQLSHVPPRLGSPPGAGSVGSRRKRTPAVSIFATVLGPDYAPSAS
jgi:hypothetical protein